jgi:hypothetical protein
MMSRLIFLTANTGFWTAAVAIVEISLVNLSLLTMAYNFAHKLDCQVASFPSGIQFLVVEIPLCNIYVNTLLANLNAREYVRGDDFTEYNSTPSRLTARTGSGNNTSGGSNIYLGGLGSAKSASQQIVRLISLRDVLKAEWLSGKPNGENWGHGGLRYWEKVSRGM